MNKNELLRILKQEGFRPNVYSLEGGLQNDCYCLEDANGVWFVYYSERGLQIDKQVFWSESEACENLLQQLRKDPTTR